VDFHPIPFRLNSQNFVPELLLPSPTCLLYRQTLSLELVSDSGTKVRLIPGILGIGPSLSQIQVRESDSIPEPEGIPGNLWNCIATQSRKSDETDYALLNTAK